MGTVRIEVPNEGTVHGGELGRRRKRFYGEVAVTLVLHVCATKRAGGLDLGAPNLVGREKVTELGSPEGLVGGKFLFQGGKGLQKKVKRLI